MISSKPQRTVLRRALVSATGAASIAVLVAGCAGGPAATSSEAYTPPDKDLKAEITYAFWDATQQDAIAANIAGFNEEYPNITVNLDVTPWEGYWTKVQTQATSDTLPDLFWLNGPNFQLYASNGKVEPITSLIDGDYIDPANYPESLVDLYNLDDTQYGVPKDFDTIGLWYNKTIFAEAGVDVPTDSWTWDDLSAAAGAISDKLADSGIYGVAAGMDGQTTYYNTIFQAGGEVVSADGTASGYDSDADRAGLTFWSDLIASGASPSIPQLTDTPADQWFTSGKVAMYYGGSWARGAIGSSDIKDDVDVAPLPSGVEKATVIHGVANVVAANSKNKQAAQALQAYLASEAAQEQQGDMGAVIPAFNGTQAAFADSYPGVNLQVFLDATAYAKPLPVSKNSAAWNALEAKLLPDVFSDGSKAAAVTKELGSQMTALLAKE
jgi:multiple sugar transport system substrate-binding protein